MIPRRTFLSAAVASFVLPLIFDRSAHAQASNKLAHMVVPFPAGGGTDAVARLTVDKIRHEYPAGLVVDNRAGASGRLGAEFVRNTEPDGLNMLFTPDFVMTIFPHSFRKLGYNRACQKFCV